MYFNMLYIYTTDCSKTLCTKWHELQLPFNSHDRQYAWYNSILLGVMNLNTTVLPEQECLILLHPNQIRILLMFAISSISEANKLRFHTRKYFRLFVR
jgi:hypothetical protein